MCKVNRRARTLALLVVRNRIVEGGAASRTGAHLSHSTCGGAQLATRVINTVLGGPAEGAIAVGPKTNPLACTSGVICTEYW